MLASPFAIWPERSPGPLRQERRSIVLGALASAALLATGCDKSKPPPAAATVSEGTAKVSIAELKPGEDVVTYVTRTRGKFDHEFYKA